MAKSGIGGPSKFTAGQGAHTTKTLKLFPYSVWVQNPFSQDRLDVYWTPRTHPANRYPVGYNVYRQVSPRTELTDPNCTVKLTAVPVTIPMYQDMGVDIRKKEHHYYVVTEVFADGAEIALSEPVTLGQHFNPPGRRFNNISPPRIYQEWRRRKNIILQNTGEIVDILIRKRSGTRCSCFNCEYEAVEDTNCPNCYGTSFEGGYCLLPDVIARVMSLQEVLSLQPVGLVLKTNPRGWLVDFPLLRNGDVMIRRNNERLAVDKVDYMMHQGILTEQGFDLIALPQGDAVYDFLIHV